MALRRLGMLKGTTGCPGGGVPVALEDGGAGGLDQGGREIGTIRRDRLLAVPAPAPVYLVMLLFQVSR